MIIAHIDRKEDKNAILFADNSKLDKVKPLFHDPFTSLTKKKYDNEHNLSDDECWEAGLSDEQFEQLKCLYELDEDSTGDMNKNKLYQTNDSIRALYMVEGDSVRFKRIFKQQLLRDSTVFNLDGEPKLSDMHNVLAIDEKVHAVVNTSAKKILFKDYRIATQLFSCLTSLYREATQTETDNLMSADIFALDEKFPTSKIGQTNRKKIAYAIEELKIDLNDESIKVRIEAEAQKYAPEGLYVDGKFNLTKNVDVTHALRIITGAYYKNPITDDEMIAKVASKAENIND